MKNPGSKKPNLKKVEAEAAATLDASNIDQFVVPNLNHSSQMLLKRQVTAIKDRDYEVRYMGLRGQSGDLFGMGKRLAQVIDQACGGLQIVGRLGTFLKLDLTMPVDSTEPSQSLFLAYLAMTPESAAIVDKLIRLDNQSVFFTPGDAPGNNYTAPKATPEASEGTPIIKSETTEKNETTKQG